MRPIGSELDNNFSPAWRSVVEAKRFGWSWQFYGFRDTQWLSSRNLGKKFEHRSSQRLMV